MSTLAIRMAGVAKSYGAHPVLHNVNLEVEIGQRVAIVGLSGSGKTTLLNLLAAFDRPDKGEVTYFARERELRISARGSVDANRIRRQIGFVFQTTHMMEGRDTQENVELPLAIDGLEKKARAVRSMKLADALGLDRALLQRTPSELSGGERQRVAVARAMIREPLLVLADEPTGNLDPHSTAAVRALLEKGTGEGRSALVLVTHDLELAQGLCGSVRVLREGTLHEAHAPRDERERTVRAMREHAERLLREFALR